MKRERMQRHTRTLACVFVVNAAYGCATHPDGPASPEATVTAFARALNEGNLAAAYASMSDDYRSHVSFEAWQKLMEENSPRGDRDEQLADPRAGSGARARASSITRPSATWCWCNRAASGSSEPMSAGFYRSVDAARGLACVRARRRTQALRRRVAARPERRQGRHDDGDARTGLGRGRARRDLVRGGELEGASRRTDRDPRRSRDAAVRRADARAIPREHGVWKSKIRSDGDAVRGTKQNAAAFAAALSLVKRRPVTRLTSEAGPRTNPSRPHPSVAAPLRPSHRRRLRPASPVPATGSPVPATGSPVPATGALVPATGAFVPATGSPSPRPALLSRDRRARARDRLIRPSNRCIRPSDRLSGPGNWCARVPATGSPVTRDWLARPAAERSSASPCLLAPPGSTARTAPPAPAPPRPPTPPSRATASTATRPAARACGPRVQSDRPCRRRRSPPYEAA